MTLHASRHSLWLVVLCLLRASVATAQLVNGSVVAGAISVPGEIDSYTFTGKINESVELRMADTSGTEFKPQMYLYRPDGALVYGSYAATVAVIGATLPQTGTYRVSVRDTLGGGIGTGDHIGTYNLYYSRAPGAKEGGALKNGQAVSGHIDLGDIDSFSFKGIAGASIELRIADTGATDFKPFISLYGPKGDRISSSYANEVGAIYAQLPRDGAYTVLVTDTFGGGIGSGDHVGDYSLNFVLAPGANEGGALPNGGLVSGRIDLGDLDSFQFDAAAGQSIDLRLADTGNGDFKPFVRVYGPSGSPVATSYGATVGAIWETLPQSGTYTVVVSDTFGGGIGFGDHVGNYNLYFAKAPGAGEHGSLLDGAVIDGQIDLGDIDTYSFFSVAGEAATITVTDLSGTLLKPWVALYGPTGQYLAGSYGNDSAQVSKTLANPGVYTVVVADTFGGGIGFGDHTGGYRLAFDGPNAKFSYVALGDSYSSGEGVSPYFNASDTLFKGCHRSTRAYSTMIDLPGTSEPIAERSDTEFDFFACSGAVTENVRASGTERYGEPPQLSPVNGVDSRRDLVTISIGGNDAQFVPIVAYCLAHNHCHDVKPFAPYIDMTIAEYFPLLAAYVGTQVFDVLMEIRDATPNAATLALAYPILMSGRECLVSGVPGTDIQLSVEEQEAMRDINAQLNTAVELAAALAGVHFAPVADAFADHEICGVKDDWINGLVPFNPKASFHPTARGQQEYARVANDYLKSHASGWPAGYLRSGLPRNPSPTVAPLATITDITGSAFPRFGDLATALVGAPAICKGGTELIVPGQMQSITGGGFIGLELVSVKLLIGGQTFALGSVRADAAGQLNTTVPIPAGVPVGKVGTIEALAAGPDGVGVLLVGLVRSEGGTVLDSDADGVPDACDTCPSFKNADQRDTDGDGFGNRCDADIDGSGFVDSADLALLKQAFGSLDPDFDLNGNGSVDKADQTILKSFIGAPPRR